MYKWFDFMNALRQFPAEPSRSPSPQHPGPQHPGQQRQRSRRPQAQSHQSRQVQRHRVMAIESGMKVGVNIGLSLIALSTLINLLPHRSIQAQKLKEVQTEVQKAEVRVGQLQADYDRVNDSTQIKSILQEQTHMVDPLQKTLIFDDRVVAEGVDEAIGESLKQPIAPGRR